MNKYQERTSSCYSPLLGQFQLKLFYCGKGRQNFASNITLYTCERSRQNHLDRLNYLFHAVIGVSESYSSKSHVSKDFQDELLVRTSRNSPMLG